VPKNRDDESCWATDYARAHDQRFLRHFHARYVEFEAAINIDTLAVIHGDLPTRALSLVREWAMIHKDELVRDWDLCRGNAAPAKIDPLI